MATPDRGKKRKIEELTVNLIEFFYPSYDFIVI